VEGSVISSRMDINRMNLIVLRLSVGLWTVVAKFEFIIVSKFNSPVISLSIRSLLVVAVLKRRLIVWILVRGHLSRLSWPLVVKWHR
jgi:hypothetical protein